MRNILLILLLVSCGKQSIELEDSEHLVGGETKSIIVVELSFISQVNELCKDLNLISDFGTYELYKQEVAKCTFDNISILNIGDISQEGFNDIINDVCSNPEYVNETICQ